MPQQLVDVQGHMVPKPIGVVGQLPGLIVSGRLGYVGQPRNFHYWAGVMQGGVIKSMTGDLGVSLGSEDMQTPTYHEFDNLQLYFGDIHNPLVPGVADGFFAIGAQNGDRSDLVAALVLIVVHNAYNFFIPTDQFIELPVIS